MERLIRDTLIEFEEREKVKLPEAKFKGRFIFLGDTDWGNVDPVQTIDSTSKISQEDLPD